jgi:hypothetical protein
MQLKQMLDGRRLRGAKGKNEKSVHFPMLY